MTCVRVIISGQVQGVGYRAWAVRTATKLNLKGWVRNVLDGTVEALFSGDESAVNAMLSACKKGPSTARVDTIASFPAAAPEEDGFTAKKPTI